MSNHIALADLAEADEGLVDPARAADVAAHLADCPECRRTVSELRQVRQILAAVRPVPMPSEIAQRLDVVVAAEHVRRDAKRAYLAGAAAPPRATLGPFQAARRPRGRVLGGALAAVALSALCGFAGYWLSAAAGLNEPRPSTVAVDSRQLAAGAGVIRRATDLEPHRFSRAWNCARRVTSGRITGLASATVDGAPALLVYTVAANGTMVTVVSGCNTDSPTAAGSTTLPR